MGRVSSDIICPKCGYKRILDFSKKVTVKLVRGTKIIDDYEEGYYLCLKCNYRWDKEEEKP